eukprot:scaffold10295_cov116-Isochrysis_galbana.AAC.1
MSAVFALPRRLLALGLRAENVDLSRGSLEREKSCLFRTVGGVQRKRGYVLRSARSRCMAAGMCEASFSAYSLAVGDDLPRAGEVVERGALLTLLVQKAEPVEEALARFRRGGAKGVADVEVLNLDAAGLAVVELFLFEFAGAHADVVAFRDEGGPGGHIVPFAALGLVVEHEGF